MDDISKRSLSISRTFDASIEMVWQLLTTPEYIKEWWGPNGFTNTIEVMDVTIGGRWEFLMHGPDGTDFENAYIYREIIPLKRITIDHIKEPKFSITINLSNEGEKTRIEWINIFETIPSLQEAIRAFNVDQGLVQNIERFKHYSNNFKIMKQTNFAVDKNKLSVTREFDAAPSLVWRAWTEAELLDQWWAPKPWQSKTKHMDFKEGGSRLYAMVGPEGEEHWGYADYNGIVVDKQFSGTDSFCDQDGVINASLPAATFKVEFDAIADRTMVTMVTTYASENEVKQIIEMGMKEGLSMAFENLDTVLANM